MSDDKYKKNKKEKLKKEFDELTEQERKLDNEGQNSGKGQSGSSGSSEGSGGSGSSDTGDPSGSGDPNVVGGPMPDIDGEDPEGEEAEGEEGENTEGNTEGEDAEGEEGENAEGENTDGEDSEGEKPEGEQDDEEGSSDESSKDDKPEPEPEPEGDKVNSKDRRNLNPDRKGTEGNDKDGKDKKDGKDSKDKKDDGVKSGDDTKTYGDLSGKDAAAKLAEKVGAHSELAQKASRAKQVASAAVNAAKGVVDFVGNLVSLLINPIFWIVIGCILLILIIISSISVIGGNDYNRLCDNNGVGGVFIGEDANDHTRQAAIGSWLMNTPFEATDGQPMNREQASAVVGNFMLESNMANPRSIGGDNTVTLWETCDNECILGWGTSGSPIGIAQWLGSRRVELVEFAIEQGTEWHDLTTQLRFLKTELDDGYNLEQLQEGGFNEPGQTLEDYTWIWQDKFERAGEARTDAIYLLREGYAQDFFARFDGPSGGMASQCIAGRGSVVDASSITSLAISIAYTREEKAEGLGYGNCGGNSGCGLTFSKAAYVDAKDMVEQETGRDPLPHLLASCDRLVATFVRLTGMDTNFPYGNTGTQISYMNSSPDWESVSCQNRQAGDVFGRSGHIMIYVGIIDGQETMVSASIGTRSAHMSNISCAGDLFRGDNMSVPGWRKVN